MNHRATLLLFAFVVSLLPHFVIDVVACTCAPRRSTYKSYREATAVFVGKVTGSRDETSTETGGGGREFNVTERIFKFAVDESFKGVKTSEVEISVGRIDSSCYGGFEVGSSYLVYAYGSEKILASYTCGRTNNFEDAAGDLYFIRNLLKGIPEPRVYGSVVLSDATVVDGQGQHRVRPLEGIKILIEGEGKKFESVTDKQGIFTLERIPDGHYKAHPDLPKRYRAYFPSEEEIVLGNSPDYYFRVQIEPGPTANLNFSAGWNNSISGTVRDAEGNTITRAKVGVLIGRGSKQSVVQQDFYDYRRDGKFQFVGLNPGRYLLSVDIRAPFIDRKKSLTFFFPSSTNPDEAEELSIGDSDSLEGRDIRLPPEYLVRQIEGVVVWPNGVPVSRAWIFLAAAKDSADDDQKFDSDSTDELGRFSIQGFVGAEYWIHGSSNSSGSGEPIKIKVEKLNESLKIVIPFPKPEPK